MVIPWEFQDSLEIGAPTNQDRLAAFQSDQQ
jgi:hypothetical protein